MLLSDFWEHVDKTIWAIDRRKLPRWRAQAVYLLQVIYATVRELLGGLTGLRAMGLVYTTLLSLVPLLAFSFSVLKGFGVHNKLEPVLLGFLEPLGDKGVEITGAIVGFVDNMQVGVLGAVGLGLLLYSVASLLKKIEMAFNYTWRVSEYRSVAQRVSNFLSVALIGPVLIFSALGITATVGKLEAVAWIQGIPIVAGVLELGGRLVPYVLIISAFTFIYILVPNTKVRFGSALTGGLIAGVLWQSTSWAFSSFVAMSTTKTAIYSGLAILFIFMIWLYLNWLILLIGATISYYHQHPERLGTRQQILRLSCRVTEKLALLIMLRIAQCFHAGTRPWTQQRLAGELDVSPDAVSLVLKALEATHFVIPTRDSTPAWLPGRSLDRIRVRDVLQAIRAADETAYLNPNALKSEAAIDQILDATGRAVDDTLGKMTLHDLLEHERPRLAAVDVTEEAREH